MIDPDPRGLDPAGAGARVRAGRAGRSRARGCGNCWSAWANPGSKYEGTRHNIGFEVIDRLAEGGSGSSFSRKFDGLVAETEIDFRRLTLLKAPETFMNLRWPLRRPDTAVSTSST